MPAWLYEDVVCPDRHRKDAADLGPSPNQVPTCFGFHGAQGFSQLQLGVEQDCLDCRMHLSTLHFAKVAAEVPRPEAHRVSARSSVEVIEVVQAWGQSFAKILGVEETFAGGVHLRRRGIANDLNNRRGRRQDGRLKAPQDLQLCKAQGLAHAERRGEVAFLSLVAHQSTRHEEVVDQKAKLSGTDGFGPQPTQERVVPLLRHVS
mmetsp:Transcript_49628/g.138905  ORF Transcript_49628/g.138905 Transcript_49628/m.138905 type:complete len:205 (+) Transcript_49628:1387-2001(+)